MRNPKTGSLAKPRDDEKKMSRIGKSPITIKPTVAVTVDGRTVSVKGIKGSLTLVIPKGITVDVKDQIILVKTEANDTKMNALHGFVRAQMVNMITGVSEGWTKTLMLSGVGYRAVVTGSDLIVTVGFSHPVTMKPPPGIQFSLTEGKIVVTGIDKQLVGQVASDIRKIKPPEPYKGKGIMYEGEHIRKKAGKSAKGVGGAPGAVK
ncbi:MAG: 50S ribosomal protein L6 [Candidatus Gottesmanbacteria bacterium GW2011_GWA2_44_17]|uniref:Large ribosomal subunit protein uL6 n=3 Tax=Candidatus Gottesmaniibacteriota TaxID=1752720 RepID=A0A0G1IPV2_9BACT|nr:MAG: 50S ribosomal protein L6 [Microgenomates group bacterium GW2011_GWC1_43_11]KKT38665.1 MAG: 50S ribosomal protein L6 [Candidatus Gottesmanbacteria bacterium GW2011_GWB1_44_11c]KKT47359.1 MAG: 50S ribosomal protein L6 [Candidatus Gottesmanbacteria bacterium GW2011_GWA2_44_17]KKT61160.1 MAG: 50S ribosomal protein L6 [Candidatus Gottesmanbacteria bacterium GW2011_GWA1_44_24b]